MKVPAPALGLATFGLTVGVPGLSIASCFAWNLADPGTVSQLFQWCAESQCPIDFGELQFLAVELKTQLLQLRELQKPLELIEPAG